MKLLLRELMGEKPTRIQVASVSVAVVFAVVLVYLARPFEWQTVVLMVMTADIAGGIVSNAAASTREHWAKMPAWVPVAFVIVHAFEVPIIWWLAGGDIVAWALTWAMLAKIGIFLIGQDEHRWSARA